MKTLLTPKQAANKIIGALNLNLLVCSYGCELAVGFSGADTSPYNLAYNYGATSGELHEMANTTKDCEGFHYFLASKESLANALTNYVMAKANHGGAFPKTEGGVIAAVQHAAKKAVDRLNFENFLGQDTAPKASHLVTSGSTDWDKDGTED